MRDCIYVLCSEFNRYSEMRVRYQMTEIEDAANYYMGMCVATYRAITYLCKLEHLEPPRAKMMKTDDISFIGLKEVNANDNT